MSRIAAPSCLFTCVLSCSLAPLRGVGQSEDALAAIHVPDGFTIERAAGPPLIERPMLASFDDQGRLYVADSSGVNLRGDELLKNPPHKIRRLEDTDHDGVFDKSIVFADKLVFPQGCLWHAGSVYTSSPPSFWKLTDIDGDGVCDRREELVTGFANTGVADDMHGASLGPDGRIYWFAGRFPHQIRKPGGPLIHKGTAPLLLRCKPDGSEIEVVCGTQGNAVGVVFTPEGDMFACGTFLAPDSMGPGLRDAIVHLVDGAEYPVRDRVLNEHKRTGELLPPLVHLGVAAAADLEIYRSDVFGKEYQKNLFSANFNYHKVLRHVLDRDGATYKCRTEEFLESKSADFHPTDVLEDADGSLLVVDTGGWFRIGCPTSQVAKPQVLGGIYRVRRKGAATGGSIVRGPSGHPAPQAADLVWSATRQGDESAQKTIREALGASDPALRQAAVRSAGLDRDGGALPRLLSLVVNDTPPIRREAATALGRLRNQESVSALFESLKTSTDRFLEHSILFALIQIGDAGAVRERLTSPEPAQLRGALIALDSIDGAGLKPEDVLPHLRSPSPVLQETALWITGRHAEWGDAMVGLLGEWITKPGFGGRKSEDLKQEVALFSSSAGVQTVVADLLASEATELEPRLLLLEAMALAPLRKLPRAWALQIDRALASKNERVLHQAVATVRAVPKDKRPALVRVEATVDHPETPGAFVGTSLEENFYARWTGLIRIADAGPHTFFTSSDDGSRLLIDGSLVVDNGGHHAWREKQGQVDLSTGDHELEIGFFEGGGEAGVQVFWLQGGKKEILPGSVLFHREVGAAGGELRPGLVAEYYDWGESPNGFPDVNLVDLTPRLLAIARDTSLAEELRVSALAAAAPELESLDNDLATALLGALGPDRDPLLRATAAEALAKARLSKEQILGLATRLIDASPLVIPRLLSAFERSGEESVGVALVTQLEKSASLSSVRLADLERILKGYPASVRTRAAGLLARLEADGAAKRARLSQLAPLLQGGDPRAGREVFYGKKASCSTCHAIGGNGGKIGPDLTRIGAIRGGPDFLESVLLPSVSFARGFEPVSVVTKDGQVFAGIVSRETAEAFHVIQSATSTVRVLRSDVAQIELAQVSIMPEGLDKQVSEPDLRNLFAFLESLK